MGERSDDITNELKKFQGTEEEQILQIHLKKTMILKKFYLNLVIQSCNVCKPVPFTNADVVLLPFYEQRQHIYEYSEEETDQQTIRFENLLNMELIQKLTAVCAAPDSSVDAAPEECKSSVLCLLKFLRDIEHHQKALSGLRESGADEAKLTAVIGHHFFSQLIPGKNYEIDKGFKNIPNECPCQLKDCKQRIQTGCTTLGSDETWHGYVDIFLNQTVAVSVIGSSSLSGNQNSDDDDDTDDETNEIPGPSSPKQLRMHGDETEKRREHSASKQLCRASSKTRKHSSKTTLLHFNVIDQIIAEAITNAFTQVNRNKALSGWLIPTFGCTLDHIVVFLYDPKNDVFLQLIEQLPLWQKTNILSVTTVVQIWMLLNFTVFMRKNIADEYRFNSSNFHCLAGKLLKEYWNLEAGKTFGIGLNYNDFYSEKVLQTLLLHGKEVSKQ